MTTKTTTTATAAKTTRTPKATEPKTAPVTAPVAPKGIGNTPASSGPVETTVLTGVVTDPRVTVADAKTTPATKTTNAKQVEVKTARDAKNAATAAMCLEFLTKNAGTAFAVRDVELATGNGPETDKVKTLRPALWALVNSGKAVAQKTEAGRKGFMVPKTAVASE